MRIERHTPGVTDVGNGHWSRCTYSAITRAKRLYIIIGQSRALELAVKNDRVALRNTGLAERLQTMRLL